MSRTLPENASLRQLRAQAKDLLKASRAADPAAVQRLRHALSRLADSSDAEVVAAGCTLQDVQFVLAREYGFSDWTALRDRVEVTPADRLEDAFEAVESGDGERLAQLLAGNGTLAQTRREAKVGTLLHMAAARGHAEIATTLIDAGADVHARAGEGWMALHTAAGMNHVGVIDALLAAGADAVAEACGAGGTALAHALFYGHQEAAQRLAQHDLQPANLRVLAGLGRVDLLPGLFAVDGTLTADAGVGRGFYRHHDEFPPWSPSSAAQQILDEALVYASNNRQQEAVRFLLDHGASVSAVPYYSSPLHAAAYNGDEGMIDLLLRNGADPTVRDTMHGGTPADWAAHGSRPELVERMRVPVASEVEEGNDTVFDLIDAGDVDRIKERIEEGADVTARRSIAWEISGKGVTKVEQALMQACATAGRADLGALLVEAGAPMDLHAAAFLGQQQVVQSCLDAGQAVDDVDAFGMTPLHRAIQGDSLEVVDLLLQHEADVDHSADTYTFGARAMHVAAACGASRQVIERLVEAGADPAHRANPGTPMQIAQRMGCDATVLALRDLLESPRG